MAGRPPQVCEAGCPNTKGHCPTHDRKPFANAKASSTLYNTTRWRKERAAQLSRQPTCRCGSPARVVDHEPPHRGNVVAFWDRKRYASLCWPCSNSKTGREIRARATQNKTIGDLRKGCAPSFLHAQDGVKSL